MAPEKGIFWAWAFENAKPYFCHSSLEIIAFAYKPQIQGPRIIVGGKVFLILKFWGGFYLIVLFKILCF